MFRITGQSTLLRQLSNIRRAQAAEAKASGVISSGKRVEKASADPAAAARIAMRTSALAATETKLALVESADTQLSSYDTPLANATDALNRVYTLAIQMGNDTFTAGDRAKAVDEVRQLKQTLISIGNTEVDGRYLFSGHRTTTAAFDTNGVYQGDDGVQTIDIGVGNTVDINLVGRQVFSGANGGVDIFASIDALDTALTTNDGDAIRASIGTLQQGVDQLVAARFTIGGRLAQVSQLRERNLDERVIHTSALATDRDADFALAATDLANARGRVEAALQAVSRVGKTSLLDLL